MADNNVEYYGCFMRIAYKNKAFEKFLIAVNIISAVVVVAVFVLLFGLREQLLPAPVLYGTLYASLFIFVIEKVFRFINAVSWREFWRANWYEVPLLVALVAAIVSARGQSNAEAIRRLAVSIYLVLQVVVKVCRTTVALAASGKNPTRMLIISFAVLIFSGTGILMLPKSAVNGRVGFVDALFTATSATCVTGLIVKDTGSDFSIMGQLTILSLIQLGGLGIVIFGAVFALLLGQALGIRESAAMQDILSEQMLGRISRMIAFIFVTTVLVEAVGAISMFGMWDDVPRSVGSVERQWYCSIFHSISAFCNAGFGLFSDSMVGYNRCWPVYVVMCPLIILGGLGFGVLYDLGSVAAGRAAAVLKRVFGAPTLFAGGIAKKMQLQSRIVLMATLMLIVSGMLAILIFERFTGGGVWDWRGAFFQSVTARTAGFNTVEISRMAASNKLVLILLMFIGGAPGGTAGGIKTTTLAVIIMAAMATLKKRGEVQVFKRSVGLLIIRRAITVTLLFIIVLFVAGFTLMITENRSGFTLMDIMFETASALGTVGLTTGITAALTTAGKLIIIVVMFVGRVGPLTLLASMTFSFRPARFSYPEEVVIVG
jgi:trk system potassium uptake protein TrkH